MLGVALGGRDAAGGGARVAGRGRAARRAGRCRSSTAPSRACTRPGRRALVGRGGATVGAVGRARPRRCSTAHGIGERVGWLEVDLDAVAELPRDPHVYRPVSIYPSSDVDLAFEVDDAVPAAAVEARHRPGRGRAPGGAAPVRRLPGPRHRPRPAQPGLRAAARRPRPHPHRRRGGRGAAPLHRGGRGHAPGDAARLTPVRAPSDAARTPAGVCQTLRRGDAAGAATAPAPRAVVPTGRAQRAGSGHRADGARTPESGRAPPRLVHEPALDGLRAWRSSRCSCSTSTACAAGSSASTCSSPSPAT